MWILQNHAFFKRSFPKYNAWEDFVSFRGEKKEPQHEDHSHQPHHPQDQQHPHEADGDDKNRTSLFW